MAKVLKFGDKYLVSYYDVVVSDMLMTLMRNKMIVPSERIDAYEIPSHIVTTLCDLKLMEVKE